ncbi:IS982 family transposase, partial [Muribaculum intestinale]
QIEHSRHRSFPNFIVNLIGGIAAYCLFPKKPRINLERVYDNQMTLF